MNAEEHLANQIAVAVCIEKEKNERVELCPIEHGQVVRPAE